MSWCHIYYITSVILYIYSGYATASEYYVSAAPNGGDCTNTSCHNLSYYIADYASYFTDDAIFYFQEGTHTLQSILEINNVSNITLQGLGHIEQGFHETVMQSTSVIRCSEGSISGIYFTNSIDVVLTLLTIVNCGLHQHTYYNVSLHFLDINSVTLEWISVQNSSGYGLVLYNAHDVLIANSSFTNNGLPETFTGNAYIINNDRFRTPSRVKIVKSNFTLSLGNGMYLWYINDKIADVIIENSMFSHNNAWHGGGVYIVLRKKSSIKISNCTINNNSAWNGGGMHIDSIANVNVNVSDTNIYNNAAHYDGGGLYIDLFTRSASIEFINCNIYNNTAQYDGGGVYITSVTASGTTGFINCNIYDNIAQSNGGGECIFFYTLFGSIEFSNCTIYNNTAHFSSGIVFHSAQVHSTRSILFTNVSFQFNKVFDKFDVHQKEFQAAVVLLNVNKVTFDQIEVSNHNTTGLVGVNSLITFQRHNMFANNSGIYGGGIALYKSSQLLLKEHVNISFVNNHASKSGGGIFVSQVFGEENTTDCFFKVIPYHDPNDTKTVLYFVNNTADISGDVLYGGKIDDCTNTPYFKHLFDYTQQIGLSVVSSDPIQVCFCQLNRPNCSITNISIFAMPGIEVNVLIATVGLQNGTTEGVIKLTSSDSSSTVQTENNRLNAICTNVTFTLRTNTLLGSKQVYATLKSSINKPLYDHYAKVIEVNIESCPNGFPLVDGMCVCRMELNSPQITCDNKTLIIKRVGDMWIGYENDSTCLVVQSHCPLHYCNDSNVTFTLNIPKKQCLYNRSGILCGQCSEGLSLMLGSNQCEQCTDNNIALIIPFAVAGIALVAFVTVLNLTVSVGTINGLIFYANVVKIYELIFFPEGSIPILSQFISWINLDLGIKTCFYHNMDSCSKAWLQFIFPAYIWLILLLIIILSHYSSKVVLLIGRQAIPVLATMILLSYTKLIRTVFQVIHYTNIQCSGKNHITLLRWYIDANVKYVGGCHLSLFLFSLAVLVLLIIPYTFYLLTIPLFEGPLSKYIHCYQKLSTYMKPFFDAYGGPYNDKCRFWTGFLLLVRVILALVVSQDIEANVSLKVLTSILVVIIFMYLLLKGIYRHFPLLYLEAFFVLNLVLMAHTNVQTSEIPEQQVTSIVLVFAAFVVFCCIILYHVWDRLLKSCLQNPTAKIKKKFKKPPPSLRSDDIKCPRSNSAVSTSVLSMDTLRESLLLEVND